jgi:hypothetical protein
MDKRVWSNKCIKFCLVTFTKVDSLYFAGSDEPGFLVKVGSIGHIGNVTRLKGKRKKE